MAQLRSWHTARQGLCLGHGELHKKVGSRQAIRRALGPKPPKLVDNGGETDILLIVGCLRPGQGTREPIQDFEVGEQRSKLWKKSKPLKIRERGKEPLDLVSFRTANRCDFERVLRHSEGR